MSASHPLIAELAREHSEHLAYLEHKLDGLLSVDEIEEVLQDAYLEAASSLKDRNRTLAFASYDKARAWLRSIAVMRAVDVDRHFTGRREQNKRVHVGIETADGSPLPLHDDRIHIEEQVIRAVDRDRTAALVKRALESISEEHQQVLKLRFDDNLSGQAIKHLLGLSTIKQYEARLTRALKALATAMSKQNVTLECGRTRLLLKRQPDPLFNEAAVGVARSHVESCLACQSFARSTRVALAALPLPALDPLRVATLEYFSRHPRTSTAAPQTQPPGGIFHSVKAIAGHKLAAATITAAVGTSGAAAATHFASAEPLPRSHKTELRSADTPSRSVKWADSASDREKLERAAREFARQRAEAARRSRATGASPQDRR